MTIRIAKFKIKINQKRFIYLSGVATLILLSFYLFNLGSAVANASRITKLEREIGSLNQKVGEMESRLIVERNNINLGLAYTLGFKETGKIKFVSKKSVATIVVAKQIQ